MTMSKVLTIKWLMEEKLIASKQKCGGCREDMSLIECTDQSDGFKWECRKQVKERRHKVTSVYSKEAGLRKVM